MSLCVDEDKRMCGRFTFHPTEEFYQRFQIINRLDGLVARYNIAPGQMVTVDHCQQPSPDRAHAVGVNSALGRGRKNGLQDDQRAGGDPRLTTGLPQSARREPLSGPCERLL
jgi:hypothetical protein